MVKNDPKIAVLAEKWSFEPLSRKLVIGPWFCIHVVFYKQMICLEVRVDFRPKLKALFEKNKFSEEMDNRK